MYYTIFLFTMLSLRNISGLSFLFLSCNNGDSKKSQMHSKCTNDVFGLCFSKCLIRCAWLCMCLSGRLYVYCVLYSQFLVLYVIQWFGKPFFVVYTIVNLIYVDIRPAFFPSFHLKNVQTSAIMVFLLQLRQINGCQFVLFYCNACRTIAFIKPFNSNRRDNNTCFMWALDRLLIPLWFLFVKINDFFQYFRWSLFWFASYLVEFFSGAFLVSSFILVRWLVRWSNMNIKITSKMGRSIWKINCVIDVIIY